MYNPVHDALLSTLAYGDIFDYPLTKEELWKYLINENAKVEMHATSEKRVLLRKNAKVLEALHVLENKNKIRHIDEYYCLRGREKIIVTRNKRKQLSRKNLEKAKWVSHILSYIPTILFIGVSGSLAMENMEKEADVDLFFITSPKTLWSTRLFVLLVLQIFGIRRKRFSKPSGGVVCANMLVDMNSCLLPKRKQNLYTAHEVAQLQPLMSKNNTYIKFIRSNKWIKNYLPNSFVILSESKESNTIDTNITSIWLIEYFFIGLFILLEPVARFFQFQYMKKYITSEIISDTLLAFHPFDYEQLIVNEYKKRLKKYKIAYSSF